MENVLRSYTRRAIGMEGLNYWDRLKKFKLFSQQRRNERYKITYVWKSLNGMVPSMGLELTEDDGMRSGPKIQIKKVIGPNEKIKNVIRDSISNFGARLYNSVPSYIPSFKGTLPQFKIILDKYLAVIPDQPAVGDMIPGARNIQGKPSNSVIDWCRSMKGVIAGLPHFEDQYVGTSL